MRIVHLIAKQVVQEALHNKLLWFFIVGLLCGLGLCEYISSIALLEAKAFQLSIYSGLIRLLAVLLLLQFVVSSIAREQHEKGLHYLLAMPLSRTEYILGKALGMGVLSLCLAALVFVALSLYQFQISTLLWSASLFFELLIVACFALFIAVSLPHTGFAAAVVIAFYTLCRVLAGVEALAGAPLVPAQSMAQAFLALVTQYLSYVLPALYQYSPTEWLLYGQYSWHDLAMNGLQSGIYCSALLAAASFDLHRKKL